MLLHVLSVQQVKFFLDHSARIIVKRDTLMLIRHVIIVPLVVLIVRPPMYVINALLDTSNRYRGIVKLVVEGVNS